MSYKGKKDSLWGRMLAAFAKDEDTSPEDLENASKLAPGAKDEEPEEPEAQQATAYDSLDARLSRIEDALYAMANDSDEEDPEYDYAEDEDPEYDYAEDDGEYEDDDEPTALDALENELVSPEQGGVEDEDDVDVPAEEINAANGEAEDDGEDVIEPGEEDDDPQTVRDAALDIIAGLKPVIAALPYAQRQRAADSMAALLRGHIQDVEYGVLARAMRNGHMANDSNPIMDDREYGRIIRDTYNPHYKKN